MAPRAGDRRRALPRIGLGLAAALTASALGAGGQARAAEGFDIARWVERPGVKLVVVEFYATWCRPCMEAVPRWKALHERFRKDGLRLVVISTRDAAGGCVNPGWTPDEVICDEEGHLADRFGAERLPAAFLWSWQGELLASGADVDEVESAVEAWMASAPRVDVQAAEVPPEVGLDTQGLRDAVRSELGRSDKLVVVASEAERSRLRSLVRASMGPFMEGSGACEVGRELSANSLLRAGISGGDRPRLHLQLFSAERGCLVAAGAAPWYADKPHTSVAEAVAVLLGDLRQPVIQRPGPARLSMAPAPAPTPTPMPRPRPREEGTLSVLASRGEAPLTADVYVDGVPVGSTPLELPLVPGSMEVEVRAPDGARRQRRVTVEAGREVRFEARFAPQPPTGVQARIPPKPESEGGGAIATGLVMMGLGAAGMVAGLVMFTEDQDGAGPIVLSGLGALSAGTGTVVLLVGGVLKMVSGARRRDWENRYGGTGAGAVDWALTPTLNRDGGAGIGLTGRF